MGKDTRVISLFSGAGGFSFGFKQAGLLPYFGADIDRDACQTYEANIGSPCHALDLAAIDPATFRAMAGGAGPFILIGGPPCQGFSTAGPRQACDPRNKLIFNYLSIVQELRPRWFILENVEGLLTSSGGADLSKLVRDFVKIGYSVRLQKVNLAAYGVPQTRKRVFVIGNRMGIDFEFPPENFSYDSGKAKKASGLPMAPTLDEALAGLGTPSIEKSQLTPYAHAQPVSEFDAMMRRGNAWPGVTQHSLASGCAEKSQIKMLQPGQTMKDLPQELWHASFQRRANRRVSDGTPTAKRGGAPSGVKRLRGDLQSLTITAAASREFIHPRADRPLTLRECARIQSFPDHYQWAGSSASVIQQIGNALPPLAANVLARHIQTLDGQCGSGLCVTTQISAPRLLGFVLTEASGMSPALRNTQTLLSGMNQPGFDFEYH